MTENIIFLQQVRDQSNTTLDVLLANVSAAANLGANAANTVTVSANNGSVRLANQINFVNSANLKVFVTAGQGQNANVTFDIGVAVAGQPQGSNTHIQYNNNGSFGGTANLTYNAATNATNVNGVFNLNGTNLASNLATIYSKANSHMVYANGTVVLANIANINFNNTSTINVSATANGTGQVNVAFSVNTSSVQSGSGTIYDYTTLATAGQTVFDVSSALITANISSAAYVIVTRNGVLQIPGTHYSVGANGGGYINQITFTSGCELNDAIDARIFSTSIAQSVIGTPGGATTTVQFNDGGSLGGDTDFEFFKANNTAQITNGSLTINGLDVKNTITTTYDTANSAANTVSVQANSAGTLNAKKLNFINTVSTLVHVTDQGNGIANVSFDSQVLLIASVSDLVTPLTAGAGKGYIRSPKTFTVTDIRASLSNISLSGVVSVQARNMGTTIGTGNIATMTGGQSLTTTANINVHQGCMTTVGWGNAPNGTPVVIDTASGHNIINDGDLIIFDINAVGTTPATTGTGLVVYIVGTG